MLPSRAARAVHYSVADQGADAAGEGMTNGRNDVVVVVPAFNEEQTVGRVVEAIGRCGYRAVVVDDGSLDRTAEVAAAAGATVLRLPVNLSIGGALRCGFRFAVTHGYRTVVQCDADGQHEPAEIAKLLDAMTREQADLVIGSRFATGHEYHVNWTRRVAMRRLARMASRRTGVPITDATSGFRAIGGRLLGAFAASYPAEYLDNIESLARVGREGYRVVEVPVEMHEREAGVSSASPVAAAWYLVRVMAAVRLQRYRPAGRRVVRLTFWEHGRT
jgi:glycosyltransferase involved in cell wall biosynthesis